MIGQNINHYTVVSQLGGGGMGVVYQASDSRLGRTVALKFLPDEYGENTLALERFSREARAASSLNHPHICTIFDVGEWESRRYIVMELLEGQNVNDALGHGSFPVDDVLEIGIQLADALDAAHQKGILHRDIKPANIIVSSRGHATLLDFGLAKLVGEDGGTSDGSDSTVTSDLALTRPGTTLGTIAYMSPEQVRGEQVDARSDLFSFGTVLYEMVTGRAAFAAGTAGLTFDAVLNRQPPPVSEIMPRVPPALAALIERSMEKDKGLRYQTAADIRAELKRIRRRNFSQIPIPMVEVPPPAAPSVPKAQPTPASRSPRASRDMDRHLRILGWAYIGWGGFRLLFGFMGWTFASVSETIGEIPFLRGGSEWFFISGAMMIVVGMGLHRRNPVARAFGLIVAVFLLLAPPVGWVVAGYAGWVLLSGGGQALFKTA